MLCDLEHHPARGALAALPERSRTALWLSDVEALTPAEIAGILGGEPLAAAALAAGARAEVGRAQQAALGRHEVRAECRFTADNLEAYRTAALDPADGVAVRAHLEECPPCRMRHDELTNGPAVLAAAVPAAPLLGGETQHHWLLAAADLRPATRLLPPGAAAAGALPRLALFRLPRPRWAAAQLGTGAGAATGPARRPAPGRPGRHEQLASPPRPDRPDGDPVDRGPGRPGFVPWLDG